VKHPDPRLRTYCELLVAEPSSVTSVRDPARAWAVHVEDALAAAPRVRSLAPAAAVDVGSGGGSPGLPLAIALGLPVTLLEATSRKCRFLERTVAAVGAPCPVVNARSEEYGRGEGRDRFDLALARALAPPPVAVELALPLVRPGGTALLWAARVDAEAVARVAALLAATVEGADELAGGRSLVILRKLGATPDRFPRRPGIARTRPLFPVPSSTA
jgi:16S rRNA (guanine527-N7)-methyltransferase